MIRNLLDFSRSRDQHLPGSLLPKRKDPVYEVGFVSDRADKNNRKGLGWHHISSISAIIGFTFWTQVLAPDISTRNYSSAYARIKIVYDHSCIVYSWDSMLCRKWSQTKLNFMLDYVKFEIYMPTWVLNFVVQTY